MKATRTQYFQPIEEIRKGDVVWIPAGAKPLARRDPKYSDDAHRNTGTAQWQSRGVDGEGGHCPRFSEHEPVISIKTRLSSLGR
jgi:hypothetical protein